MDIFEEKEQPKLYIADIVVDVLIPTRSKKNNLFDKTTVKLERYPITLIDGQMPTSRYERNFFYLIYSRYIKRNDFEKIRFKVSSITNIKFSSNLNYKFDYLKH